MTTQPTDEGIENEIRHILLRLTELAPESKEYTTAAANLKILTDARSLKNKREVSADTIISGAVSLISIMLIMNYEKLNVFGSRSIPFIPRVRS
jgi:hypothetical protein